MRLYHNVLDCASTILLLAVSSFTIGRVKLLWSFCLTNSLCCRFSLGYSCSCPYVWSPSGSRLLRQISVPAFRICWNLSLPGMLLLWSCQHIPCSYRLHSFLSSWNPRPLSFPCSWYRLSAWIAFPVLLRSIPSDFGWSGLTIYDSPVLLCSFPLHRFSVCSLSPRSFP